MARKKVTQSRPKMNPDTEGGITVAITEDEFHALNKLSLTLNGLHRLMDRSMDTDFEAVEIANLLVCFADFSQ